MREAIQDSITHVLSRDGWLIILDIYKKEVERHKSDLMTLHTLPSSDPKPFAASASIAALKYFMELIYHNSSGDEIPYQIKELFK